MRARRLLMIAGLTSTLGLAACGGDDAGPSVTERTLTFAERPTDNFSFADTPPRTKMGEEGPERLSNGDQLTFSSDLLDKAGKDAGDLEVVCAVTRPGGFATSHQQCTGTASLPGGILTLARGGRVFGGDDPNGSILGGTGAFAGATGVFTETEESEDRTTYTFRVSTTDPGS